MEATSATKKELKVPKGKAVHTVPHKDGWANKRAGAQKASKVYATKKAAQEAGRASAKRSKVEHLIHRKDGTIGERNSYGNDPRRTKG